MPDGGMRGGEDNQPGRGPSIGETLSPRHRRKPGGGGIPLTCFM
jgi:hypothetical protein